MAKKSAIMNPAGKLPFRTSIVTLSHGYPLMGGLETVTYDCIFVHVPKAANHYLPLGEFWNITYLPQGLPGISCLLQRHGLSTEIIHLGVEWIVDSAFNLLDYIDRHDVRSIGITLHWHYQAYDAIRVAQKLKAHRPEIFVFIGGLTASYFADEIIRDYPFVDAVIRGNGELPTLALVKILKTGGDFHQVPNLVWRHPDSGVMDNGERGIRYFSDREMLEELSYADLSLLRNWPIYVQSFGFPLAYSREYNQEENRRLLCMKNTFFPLATGRGCPVSCSYCGGNLDTLHQTLGAPNILWRSHDAVVSDIQKALQMGYRTVSISRDPRPAGDDYFIELFGRIRNQRIPVNLYFESWALPTRRFIEEWARTFSPADSTIALSPDSGNEAVRRKNKGYYYDNARLLETMDLLRTRRITTDVFYTLALPGETVQQAMETQDQISYMAETYPNLGRLMTWSIQLEPGSPMYERPADFGIETDRTSFKDYYQCHGGPDADTYSGLGYKIFNFFGDERDRGGIREFTREIQKLKCLEFCFLTPDPGSFASPSEGRRHCLERRRMLAQKRGTPLPEREISHEYDYHDALKESSIMGSEGRAQWV